MFKFNNFRHFYKIANDSNTITCLGAGNGSELIAFATYLNELNDTQKKYRIEIQDLADYSRILEKIEREVRFAYPSLDVSFDYRVYDLLNPKAKSNPVNISKSHIITAFFVLNELLSTSKIGFVNLVKELCMKMQRGCLLLVVDSAGSFSDVQVF